MRFLLDENADRRLGPFLTAAGHDVATISFDYTRALPDTDVIAIALREQRVIITNDQDFGELIVREGLPHAGVIFFRLRSTALAVKRARLEYVLTQYADRLHEFLVVTEGQVRIRRPRPRAG
ncbi:MAG: DUF5615 family PIN-like protein [Dehalococcoidia bacterium]